MDRKDASIDVSKDASLTSSSKNSEPKHTQVFVLPPELLKGLLIKNQISKINTPKKTEASKTSQNFIISEGPSKNTSTVDIETNEKEKVESVNLCENQNNQISTTDDKQKKSIKKPCRKKSIQPRIKKSTLKNIASNHFKNQVDIKTESIITKEIKQSESNAKLNEIELDDKHEQSTEQDHITTGISNTENQELYNKFTNEPLSQNDIILDVAGKTEDEEIINNQINIQGSAMTVNILEKIKTSNISHNYVTMEKSLKNSTVINETNKVEKDESTDLFENQYSRSTTKDTEQNINNKVNFSGKHSVEEMEKLSSEMVPFSQSKIQVDVKTSKSKITKLRKQSESNTELNEIKLNDNHDPTIREDLNIVNQDRENQQEMQHNFTNESFPQNIIIYDVPSETKNEQTLNNDVIDIGKVQDREISVNILEKNEATNTSHNFLTTDKPLKSISTVISETNKIEMDESTNLSENQSNQNTNKDDEQPINKVENFNEKRSFEKTKKSSLKRVPLTQSKIQVNVKARKSRITKQRKQSDSNTELNKIESDDKNKLTTNEDLNFGNPDEENHQKMLNNFTNESFPQNIIIYDIPNKTEDENTFKDDHISVSKDQSQEKSVTLEKKAEVLKTSHKLAMSEKFLKITNEISSESNEIKQGESTNLCESSTNQNTTKDDKQRKDIKKPSKTISSKQNITNSSLKSVTSSHLKNKVNEKLDESKNKKQTKLLENNSEVNDTESQNKHEQNSEQDSIETGIPCAESPELLDKFTDESLSENIITSDISDKTEYEKILNDQISDSSNIRNSEMSVNLLKKSDLSTSSHHNFDMSEKPLKSTNTFDCETNEIDKVEATNLCENQNQYTIKGVEQNKNIEENFSEKHSFEEIRKSPLKNLASNYFKTQVDITDSKPKIKKQRKQSTNNPEVNEIEFVNEHSQTIEEDLDEISNVASNTSQLQNNKRNQEKDIVNNEDILKDDNFFKKVNRKSSLKIGEFTNMVCTSNDEKLPYKNSESNDNNAIYYKTQILNITNKLKNLDEIDNSKNLSIIDDITNEESKEKNYLNNEVIAKVDDVLLNEASSSLPVKIEDSVNIVKIYDDIKISPNDKISNVLNESKVLDNEGSQRKNHVNNESITKSDDFSKDIDNILPLTIDESILKINEEKLPTIKEKSNDDNKIHQHENFLNISNVFKDLDTIDSNKRANIINNKITTENTSLNELQLNDKIVVKDTVLSLEQTIDKNDEILEEDTEIIEEIEYCIVEEIIEVEDRVENQNNFIENTIVNTEDHKNNELVKVKNLDLMESVSCDEIHQLNKDILIEKEFCNDDEFRINPKQGNSLKVYANRRKLKTQGNYDKNTEKFNINTKNYNESTCNIKGEHSFNLNLDVEDTSVNSTLPEGIFEFSEMDNFAEIGGNSIRCYDEKVLKNYEHEEKINTFADKNKQREQKYFHNSSETFFDKNSQISNYVKEEPAKVTKLLEPLTGLCESNNAEPKLLNVNNELVNKNSNIFDISSKNKISDKAKKSTIFMQTIKSPSTNQEYEIENDQNYDVINDQFKNFKDPNLKEETRDLNIIKTAENVIEPTGKNKKSERKNYIGKKIINDLHQEAKIFEMNEIVNDKCRILRARNRSISILNSVYKKIETPSTRTRSKSLNFNKEHLIIPNINFEVSYNEQYRKKEDENPKETEKEEMNNYTKLEETSINKNYSEKDFNNSAFEEKIETNVEQNELIKQKYFHKDSEESINNNSQISDCIKDVPVKVTKIPDQEKGLHESNNIKAEKVFKEPEVLNIINEQHSKTTFENQMATITNDESCCEPNDQSFQDSSTEEKIRNVKTINTAENSNELTENNKKSKRKNNHITMKQISDMDKEINSSENIEIVQGTVPEKKRRGRPSKKRIDNNATEIIAEDTTENAIGIARDFATETTAENKGTVLKQKRRGRPPKNRIDIDKSTEIINENDQSISMPADNNATEIAAENPTDTVTKNTTENAIDNQGTVFKQKRRRRQLKKRIDVDISMEIINKNDQSISMPADNNATASATENAIEIATEIVTENATEIATENTIENAVEIATENDTEIAPESTTENAIEIASENATENKGTVFKQKRRGRPPKKRIDVDKSTEIINEKDQSISMPADNNATASPTENATEIVTEIATENNIENAIEIATKNATENTIESAVEIATESATDIATENTTESATENKGTVLKQKRRGRPPKKSIDIKSDKSINKPEQLFTENVQNISLPDDNNTETDKDVSVEEDNFDEPIIPKKRRGRPPKNSILPKTKEIKVEISDDDSVPLAIRSRKRKRSSMSSIDRESKRRRLSRFSDSDKESKERLSDESNSEIDDGESDDRPLKKRIRHFNLYKGRKKGRPKGGGRKRNDDDYVPHHSQIKKDSKTDTTKIRRPAEPVVKKMVTCGKCDKEMLKPQWTHHNLSVHNDLGWLKGSEKPDFDNDEKLVKRVLFNAIKRRRGGLICEICHVVKRSVLGFLSHVTFCGKDEEEKQALMVTCPVCNAVTKPSSLEYHERLHKMQAEENQRISLEELENDGPKGKRKAAEKALSKISEFTALVKEDKDNNLLIDTKLKLKSSPVKKLIKKPQLKKRFPNTTLIKWTKDLESGKDAMCNQPGCEFTSKSIDEIKEHYSMCNFTPQKNYVCKICKFQSLSENEIIKHALQKHSTEDNDDTNLSISDAESSSSGNLSEVDEMSRENRREGLFKKFFLKESIDNSNKMFKFLFKDGACHTKYNKPFFGAFQWTLEFEENNYDFNLFKEYMPNTFKLLNEHESITYLPELEESMSMKSVKSGNRNSAESDWKKWKLFEGKCIEDNPTFFVGGPVWALAWLPIPTSLSFSENVQQYIAISTHSTMDVQYSVGQNYSGKNIIQIWKLGDLDHKTNSKQDPELAYAIAHDGGTVWCLDWCPSGCYQHEDMFDFIKENNEPRRMGLLAAACSDGCIRVYSLIFPDDLPSSSINADSMKNSGRNYPIYNTEPVLMLVVNKEMYYNKQQTWQVTKLSWSKENKHSVVVAGFSNGYVALWDLTSKSPMVKSKNGNTVFLNPYRHFMAHYHAITMVHLIPQDNKRFLATASIDRFYKFWDLEDVTYPRNTYKKSFVTDGTWLNHWCCALLAYDEGLSMTHNYAYCLPLREYTYKYYNVLPTNSTSYAISASDYGNSIATGTLAGEVLAMFPQQLLYVRDMDKILPRKRFISMISSTEVVDFQATESNKKADNKNDKEYQYKPSSYSDSKDRFGIKFTDRMSQFRDENTTRKNYKKTLTCEMMQSVPIEQYSFMSANRVAWNPNAWSFLWLAVGYQSGFVRLISFKSLATANEWNKLLESHINNLKCKSTISEQTRNDGS